MQLSPRRKSRWKLRKKRLNKIVVKPTEEVQNVMKSAGAAPMKEAVKAYDLLKRPELTYEHVEKMIENGENISEDVKEQVAIQIKYEGYIKKAREQVARMLKMEDKKIPADIDYTAINGIATEAIEKLKKSPSAVCWSSIQNFRSKPCRHFHPSCLH